MVRKNSHMVEIIEEKGSGLLLGGDPALEKLGTPRGKPRGVFVCPMFFLFIGIP